jgi:aryl-alcohol dehydrogenase-like predicted oxidoreductase
MVTPVGRRRLGRSDVEVSSIGLGCWQFASGVGIGGMYWDPVPQDTVDGIVSASLKGGIDWFDTAEIYGNGHSERSLAEALVRANKKNGELVIATKWWPLFRTAASITETFVDRVDRLKPFAIDLHQVHQPFAIASVKAQMDRMAQLVTSKSIRAIGVSNFSATRMRASHAMLGKHGVPLATNQVRYSLLDRSIERNGVLAAAKELGISIIAYSPLAQGILTGKFHDDPKIIGERGGPRKLLPQFWGSGLAKTKPLIDELSAIAVAHGASTAQVALAWVLQIHGDMIVAIPGATKASHVDTNVGAMSLRLTDAEVTKLDEMSR